MRLGDFGVIISKVLGGVSMLAETVWMKLQLANEYCVNMTVSNKQNYKFQSNRFSVCFFFKNKTSCRKYTEFAQQVYYM